MLASVRYQLLYGPYRPPQCKVGRTWLRCAIRGPVRVAGISDTLMSWPLCKAGKHLVPIVCGRLVTAIERESSLALQHWFGVSPWKVWQWRRALKVPRTNEGTRQLHSNWSPEVLTDTARARARKSCTSPAFAERQRELRKGKPRPAHVQKLLKSMNRGRRASRKTRAKMQAAHRAIWARRREAGEGWQTKWDKLLGTATDKELAARLGVHPGTVFERRQALRIRSKRRHKRMTPPRIWTAEDDRLLGTAPDPVLAKVLGCTTVMVGNRRRALRIPAWKAE